MLTGQFMLNQFEQILRNSRFLSIPAHHLARAEGYRDEYGPHGILQEIVHSITYATFNLETVKWFEPP
jgi:hypothetical protein